jgi:AraC-like DNA-binding protein
MDRKNDRSRSGSSRKIRLTHATPHPTSQAGRPIRIVALLPELRACGVRNRLCPDDLLDLAVNPSALRRLADSRQYDALLVGIFGDQSSISLEDVPDVVRVASRAGLPIVLECDCDPFGLRAVRAFAGASEAHVVIRGHTEPGTDLRTVLARVSETLVRVGVLRVLEPGLSALRPRIRAGLLRLFADPVQFRRVSDLASDTGVPRRTHDRCLARAGLPSPARLWHAARVVHAYESLQTATVAAVARSCGYSDPKLLTREVRLVTQMSPAVLRRSTEPEAVAAIATYLSSRTRRRSVAMGGSRTRLAAPQPSAHCEAIMLA